eukprot:1014016-Rhodomonas_salina.1
MLESEACAEFIVYESFEWQTFSIPLASASQNRTGNGVGAYQLYHELMPSQRFSPKVDSTRLTVNLLSACSRRKNNLQHSSGFRIKVDGSFCLRCRGYPGTRPSRSNHSGTNANSSTL